VKTFNSPAVDRPATPVLLEPVPPAPETARSVLWLRRIWFVARVLGALFLFIGALQLMKTGAGNLNILADDGFLLRNAGTTFGLGWVGALIVLSGSPIAASAVSLVAAGRVSETEGFTMLAGSRMGASFVVLVVAVVYALRGGHGKRLTPLSTAVTAWVTTAIIYIPATFLGIFLLGSGPLRSLDLRAPPQLANFIDLLYGRVIEIAARAPAGFVFIGGVLVLLLSMKILDGVVPTLGAGTLGAERMSWLRKKWPMFLIGAIVALVTMSVSVALTVLVPVVSKGYLKRVEIIPYVMGANILTLGDTLFAALTLDSPGAARIVLTGILSTTLISVFLLALAYGPLMRLIEILRRTMLRSHRHLALFVSALFLVPVSIVAITAAFQ
jgi:solute carrier family 34 (sodium-dependent phosphate cotransporter)